ncbi:MAG: hypothetical protein KIT60_01425 [Burkholderiaceae bacterium]|nr:hypothetical protein [Burkholderiaceae bacterium]
MQRRQFTFSTTALLMVPAWAHHGWSSFDQTRPIYLEGKARKVSWRNPHVELELELPADLKLPGDLARRPVPAQSAPVDGAKLLASAQLPTRKDKVWEIELAPLTRLEAWRVAEIKPGAELSVLGFTFGDEKGGPVLRAEYLWVSGKAYGMRSSPA